jgi:hypothetical protein
MTTTLRDHPHLSILPMSACFDLFEQARINFNQLEKLTGYSRMSLYLWRRGDRQPRFDARERVSKLAHKAKAGLGQGVLPLPPRCSVERVLATFDRIELPEATEQ